MALKPELTEHARTAGHVSHETQVRVDKRVQKILARRDRPDDLAAHEAYFAARRDGAGTR